MNLEQRKKILIESLLKEFVINNFDKELPKKNTVNEYKEYFPTAIKSVKAANEIFETFKGKEINSNIGGSVYKKQDGSLFSIQYHQYYDIKAKVSVHMIFLTENYKTANENKISPIVVMSDDFSKDSLSLKRKFKFMRDI